jgi:alkyl sulfatase BDS1-like metallo-beta-lactamase superfamily hydrolase
VTIPRLIPPPRAAIASSPTTFVNYFCVRIDPEKSGDTDKVLRFDFAYGSSAGLHIRRAVAEFVASQDEHYRAPEITLALSGETLVKLYLNQETPGDLIENGEIQVTGDDAEAARLINLFDRYVPAKNVTIPPAAFSTQR